MKKTHNGKQVPFFHIFNKLSDSINFTTAVFVIYFYCRPCNGCAVYRLISVSAKQHPSEY